MKGPLCSQHKTPFGRSIDGAPFFFQLNECFLFSPAFFFCAGENRAGSMLSLLDFFLLINELWAPFLMIILLFFFFFSPFRPILFPFFPYITREWWMGLDWLFFSFLGLWGIPSLNAVLVFSFLLLVLPFSH